VLQASPELRFKRASRVRERLRYRLGRVHQGLKAIAAQAARIVLVVAPSR